MRRTFFRLKRVDSINHRKRYVWPAVREESCADIVVFDPRTLKNNAVYGNPCQYLTGMPYVLVNGEVVVDEGTRTDALLGRVLRRSPKIN
jgi:N-acyl-D-aspartate/D-glutamate deacylase